MDKNGGDWRSLQEVEFPNSAAEAALVRHDIDVDLMTSPVLDVALAAGTTRTIGDAFEAIAPVFMMGAYVARPDWAAQHCDAIRTFNRVLAVAVNYVNTHLTETAPLVTELTKVPLPTVLKMARTR